MSRLRLALEVNPVKECQSCARRDEREVSSQILSYQIAHQLLSRVPGHIQVDGNFLILNLEGHDPLYFDLSLGSVRVRNLNIPFEQRYNREKAVDELVRKIMQEAQINPSYGTYTIDPITTLIVKLIEIYHARCCLHIASVHVQDANSIWEIKLHEDGPSGWIQSNGILRNSFGEEMSIQNWEHLRPEKLAMYVFGFYRFCSHFPSPTK
ncbi:hypothetical protein [Desulfitobacterium dichloroeliminans]|uniref:hypothetical protein n=1 Tax=Desulfitobacterium dichloroeliminans TaxID=233055 RepID=UPI00059C5BAD|nr:hypothetical protein [Desulfitobacterium dichloroeliminans]